MPTDTPRGSSRRFDLSRDTFDPAKHLRSVVGLQGRVTVEADANEQRRIDLHRDDLTTQDVIGLTGSPKSDGGFLIVAKGKDLSIGVGPIYVGGMLCENGDPAASLLSQPDLAFAATPAALADVPGYAGDGDYAAILQVWERDITPIDDPSIVEKALGGPDTSARTKTAWAVVLQPQSGQTCPPSTVDAAPAGTLQAKTVASAAARDCALPPDAGFQGQENQLYRVEVHQPGALGAATFKWSRENAAVVAAVVAPASGAISTTFTVAVSTLDQTLAFSDGDWVELSDDWRESRGHAGVLARIKTVVNGVVTLAAPLGGTIRAELHAKVRRWDQVSATTGDLAATAAWTPLENGVQVAFGGGPFSTGDYWVIPARTAIDETTGVLDFPAAPQPARSAPRWRTPLAVVSVAGGAFTVRHDCRVPFPPLTAITASDVSYATDCPDLAGAKTVQQALDILCARGDGVCTVAVTPGPGWDKPLRALDAAETPLVEICFAAGRYETDTPIPFEGFKSIRLGGAAAGSQIQVDAEAGLTFVECDAAIVRDIAVTTLQANLEKKIPYGTANYPVGINAALGFVAVAVVDVQSVTLACAGGSDRRMAACLAVHNGGMPRPLGRGVGSVRVKGCRMTVGDMQTGVLITAVDRAVVEDNEIACPRVPLPLGNPIYLRNPAYVGRLGRLFLDGVSIAKGAAAERVRDEAALERAAPKRRMARKTVPADAPPPSLRETATNTMGKRSFVVDHQGYALRFGGAPSLGEAYAAILAKASTPSTSVMETVGRVQAIAKEMAIDAGLRKAYPQAGLIYRQAEADNLATGHRGVSIAGDYLREARVAGNVLDGFLEGVAVALSHSRRGGAEGLGVVPPGPLPHSGHADVAGSVRVTGNTITVLAPATTLTLPHSGVFVGNVADCTVSENLITMIPSQLRQVEGQGIKIYGVHGPYIMVASNRMTGFNHAIRFIHTLKNAPDYENGRQLWVYRDNLTIQVNNPTPDTNMPDKLAQQGNVDIG